MQYYKELAGKLFKNGYSPIPIRPKSKVPFFSKGESWQVEITQDVVGEWRNNGKGSGGIALTGICAIDCDIYNKDVSNRLIKSIKEEINSDVLIRIGQPPKFLLPVSAESDITKKRKNTWFDQDGQKH